MPSTPFIGVLISWLILARNSDLARSADSARRFHQHVRLLQLVLRGGDIAHHRHEDEQRRRYADQEDDDGDRDKDVAQPVVAAHHVVAQLGRGSVEIGAHALVGEDLQIGKDALRQPRGMVGEQVEPAGERDHLLDIVPERGRSALAAPYPHQRLGHMQAGDGGEKR
jgi:hypothetical protein